MTKKELVGSNVRLVTAVVLSGFASYASYRIHMTLGRDWAGDELIPLFVGPVGFVAVFLFMLLFNFLFRAPYELWGTVEDRVGELEQVLRPRFTVFAPPKQRPQPIHYGSNVMTADGKVHSVIQRANYLLSMEISNRTAKSLDSCEAYLSQLRRVDGGGDEGEQVPWQSLRLAFVPIGDEKTVTIPPHGQRTLSVFKVLGYNRAHLTTNETVPVRLAHFIQDKAEYEGVVTVTARNADAATQIWFRLTCDAPENEPIMTVIESSEIAAS